MVHYLLVVHFVNLQAHFLICLSIRMNGQKAQQLLQKCTAGIKSNPNKNYSLSKSAEK